MEPPFVAKNPFTTTAPWPFTWRRKQKAEPADVEHRPRAPWRPGQAIFSQTVGVQHPLEKRYLPDDGLLSPPELDSEPEGDGYEPNTWARGAGSAQANQTEWTPELEEALLEGLEAYVPDDSRETRMLGRFPPRNRFISGYILEKTGERRSAKDVGSRLQQLRELAVAKPRLLSTAQQEEYRGSPSADPYFVEQPTSHFPPTRNEDFDYGSSAYYHPQSGLGSALSHRSYQEPESDAENSDPDAPNCSHCGKRAASARRRNKAGAQVCNACGFYERMNGRPRPLELRSDKVRPREQRRNQESSPKELDSGAQQLDEWGDAKPLPPLSGRFDATGPSELASQIPGPSHRERELSLIAEEDSRLGASTAPMREAWYSAPRPTHTTYDMMPSYSLQSASPYAYDNSDSASESSASSASESSYGAVVDGNVSQFDIVPPSPSDSSSSLPLRVFPLPLPHEFPSRAPRALPPLAGPSSSTINITIEPPSRNVSADSLSLPGRTSFMRPSTIRRPPLLSNYGSPEPRRVPAEEIERLSKMLSALRRGSSDDLGSASLPPPVTSSIHLPPPHEISPSIRPQPTRSSTSIHRRSASLPPPVTQRASKDVDITTFSFVDAVQNILLFSTFIFLDFAPRQLYMHLLLRIPALYFSRVARIFEDAQLSLPDIKRMARAKAAQWNADSGRHQSRMIQAPLHRDEEPLPPSLLIFRASWEGFIDALLREWKTFNVISVLLMSAILTLLQIDGTSHPVTRTTALFSLLCALMSLLYGCMYIIRFGTMRKMHKASSFAREAEKGTASTWWNVWVLLAMPAIWLSWSIITFFASIMSFIWLTGSSADIQTVLLSPRAALGPRIGLTLVFALGIVYFCLIVREFHKYGDPLDREWTRVVNEWAIEKEKHDAPDDTNLVSMRELKVSSAPSKPVNEPSRNLTSTITGPPENMKKPRAIPDDMDSLLRIRNVSPMASPEQQIRPDSNPLRFTSLPVSNPLRFTSLPMATAPPLATPPAAFSKPPRVPVTHLSYPFRVVRLGKGGPVQASREAYLHPAWFHSIEKDDWDRFLLDVSGAWSGSLRLESGDGSFGQKNLPDVPMERDLEQRIHQPKTRSLRSMAPPSQGHGLPFLSLFTTTNKPTVAALDDDSPASSSSEMTSADNPEASHRPPEDVVLQLLDVWNHRYFHIRNLEAVAEASNGEYDISLRMRNPPIPPSYYLFPGDLGRTPKIHVLAKI